MAALQNAVDNDMSNMSSNISLKTSDDLSSPAPNLAQSSDDSDSSNSPPNSPKTTPASPSTTNDVVANTTTGAKLLTEEELARQRKQEVLERKRAEILAALDKKRAENAALAKLMFSGEEEVRERPAKETLLFVHSFIPLLTRHVTFNTLFLFLSQVEGPCYDPFAAKYDKKPKEKMNQTAVGGAKGKEGRADHTAGKNKFVRPCTVGWKSQNQPLARGGGGRTPRQKG